MRWSGLGTTVQVAIVAVFPWLPVPLCGQAADSRAAILAEIPEIKPDVYLLSAPEGNMLVLLGEDGPMVIGIPAPSLMAMVCQFLSVKGAPPLKYALIADADSALARGDGGWGRSGVTTISHENIRKFVRFAGESDTAMAGRLPGIGFSDVFQIRVNDEEIHAMHRPGGFSNADMIVHFEDRHFFYLGNMFTTDGYPSMDLEREGSFGGLISRASRFLEKWEKQPEWAEPVVPGRGPPGTLGDMRAFHDMLVTVRDRIAPMIADGRNLEEVLAARPTMDFDDRWGRGPLSPDAFVTLAFRSLAYEAATRQRDQSSTAGSPPAASHGSH